LYQMLEDAEREGWNDVIHWMPHGRSIRVPLKDKFVSEILPRYFRDQTKWSSFSRQLRLYGFARVSKGVDLGKSLSCDSILVIILLKQRRFPSHQSLQIRIITSSFSRAAASWCDT
jgi:hypothetical protein